MALSGTDFDSSNKIKLHISPANVGSTLTNFPVVIQIGAASGPGNADLTEVFDDVDDGLGAGDSLKIAVEDGDTGNQCYVEVEKFDATAKVMTLHVKVPSLSHTAMTYLWLYYDDDASDNTTYVGVPGSTAAQSVWDASYEYVCHMANDPLNDTASAVKDSTSNNYDGTSSGAMGTGGDGGNPVSTPSVGYGLLFDNSNDYIDLGTAGPDLLADFTVEVSFIPDGTFDAGAANNSPIIHRLTGNTQFRFSLTTGNGRGTMYLGVGGSIAQLYTDRASWTDATPYHVSFAFTDGAPADYAYYINGAQEAVNTTSSIASGAANQMYAGYDGADYFDGTINEIRLSNTDRSEDWILATHLALEDNLVNAVADGDVDIEGSIFGTQGMEGSITAETQNNQVTGTILEVSGSFELVESHDAVITGSLFTVRGSFEVTPNYIVGTLFSLTGGFEADVDAQASVAGQLFRDGLTGSFTAESGIAAVVTGTLFSLSSTIVAESGQYNTITGQIFSQMTSTIEAVNHSYVTLGGTLFTMEGLIEAQSANLTYVYDDALSHSRFTKC